MTHNILGIGLWYAGKINEADAVFRTALARDSSDEIIVLNLIAMYVETGRTQEASALLAALHDTSSLNHALVRAASDRAARRAALEMLGRLRAEHLGGRPEIRVARWYARLGEKEAALAMLEQAATERNPGLEMITVEPGWDSVRADPRFGAVVRRIGLTP
jgi:thioredoxin-like negative regulator of GroEL